MVIIVQSTTYEDFNSIEEGLYFTSRYNATIYIGDKVSKLPKELRENFNVDEVFINELETNQ